MDSVVQTTWRLEPEASASDAQDIVLLTSFWRHERWMAVATRIRVAALTGGGLETEYVDSVLILEGKEWASHADFHAAAVTEVEGRRVMDYEVADLFQLGALDG